MVWFAASTTVQALVCGSIVIGIFLVTRDFRLGFRMQNAKDILKRSQHYVFAGIAVSLYTQMDKVMLGRMLGEREVGIYTAAMTISMIWEFIPTAIFNSSRTMILEAKLRDEKEYQEKLKCLLFAITVLGLFVGLVVQVFGRLAVWILYGREYMDAVPVLRLLIWSTSFAVIGVARNVWSVAEDKNRYSKYYPICGAVFNLVFNALTIPIWGIYGAALGTMLAQVIVAFVSPLFWTETRPFVRLYLESLKSGPYLMSWLKK